jgi:hypothetical protein
VLVLAISNLPLGSIDFSSRPNRRKAVSRIVGILTLICSEEESYINRIPLNLQGGEAYAAAEESVVMLTDAIDSLLDAY